MASEHGPRSGMEPALGGELRPPRRSFAPQPYPDMLDNTIVYLQTLSLPAAVEHVVYHVEPAMHPHLMMAAIAAVRDPANDLSAQRAAAALLDRMVQHGSIHIELDADTVTLLHTLAATADDYLIRCHAARALTHAGLGQDMPKAGPEDIETLAAILREGPMLARRQAALALGESADARAAAPLLEALEIGEDFVMVALGALGAHLPDPERAFAQILAAAQQVQSVAARKAAAWALGRLSAHLGAGAMWAQAIDLLWDMMGGEYGLRYAAALALGQIGGQVQDAELQMRALAPLLRMPRQDAHFKLRLTGAEALGQAGAYIGDRAVLARIVAVLADALGDNVAAVRLAAAAALARMARREDGPEVCAPAAGALEALLDSPYTEIRQTAAEILYRIRGEESTEA